MAPRKAISTLSVASTGFVYPIIDAPPMPSTVIEDTKIAAFGDKSKTSVPTDLQEYEDMAITLLDEGDKDPPKKGVVEEFTFTSLYSDGSAAPVPRTVKRKCYVKACAPGVIAVDGERKATWAVTLVPQGGDDPDTLGFGKGTAGA